MENKLAPVTELLRLVSQGDEEAREALLNAIHGELRKLAAACMRKERGDHTLQPTALVNEAYIRLMDQTSRPWQSRGHFLAAAAQVMRRVLVDYARAKRAKKRAGEAVRVVLSEDICVTGQPWDEQVLDLDAALLKLAQFDARQAKIIEMRFFTGMTEEEVAEVLGVSERTVKRDCKAGRAWLYGELQPKRRITSTPGKG